MRRSIGGAWLGLFVLVACGDDGGGAMGTTGSSSSTTAPMLTTAPPADSSTSGASSTGADETSSSSSSSSGGESDSGSSTTGAPPSIVDQGCPECIVLVDGLVGGRGIAVDESFVYFTDQSSGVVGRIQISGGDGGEIAMGQDSPYDVAVDATHVYWTNYVDAGAVMRAPKEGGAAQEVASANRPRPIAVDEGHVYWGTFDELAGSVYRRDVALGKSQEQLANLAGGVAEVALGKGRLYFTAHSTFAGGGFIVEPPMGPPVGAIYYVSLGGTIDPLAPVQVATDQAEPWGIAYLGGGQLFWANGDGVTSNLSDSIVTLPPGGMPDAFELDATAPWGVAVDGTYVYWTDAIEVGAVAIDGKSEAIVLANVQNNARSIAVDADWVFWITKNRVLQRPKP